MSVGNLLLQKFHRRRRFKIRYAKCARQAFMIGGASAAGRMTVYWGTGFGTK